MKMILRLCAGVLFTGSMIGCCCLHDPCGPYSGYYGAIPNDCCPPVATNCYAPPPVAPCPPPVDPCACPPVVDPCAPNCSTGCCLLDAVGHILDSLHSMHLHGYGCGYGGGYRGGYRGGYGGGYGGGCYPPTPACGPCDPCGACPTTRPGQVFPPGYVAPPLTTPQLVPNPNVSYLHLH